MVCEYFYLKSIKQLGVRNKLFFKNRFHECKEKKGFVLGQ